MGDHLISFFKPPRFKAVTFTPSSLKVHWPRQNAGASFLQPVLAEIYDLSAPLIPLPLRAVVGGANVRHFCFKTRKP